MRRMLAIAAAAAFTLSACSGALVGPQGIVGGGKPTTVKCKGKGAFTSGTLAIQGDCPDGFEIEINIQDADELEVLEIL